MKGFKKAITLFVISALCLTASCSNSTTPQNKASDKEIEKENKNEVVEAPVELIYAKSPEEAAEKCLEAIRSGNLDEAKHYVEYNGNAFKEISEFKSKMMTSYKAENNDTRREKVEKYISNFFGELTYSKKSSEQSDNSATVIYSVSRILYSYLLYGKFEMYGIYSVECTVKGENLDLPNEVTATSTDWEEWAEKYLRNPTGELQRIRISRIQ